VKIRLIHTNGKKECSYGGPLEIHKSDLRNRVELCCTCTSLVSYLGLTMMST
jgi:hypothetical protein